LETLVFEADGPPDTSTAGMTWLWSLLCSTCTAFAVTGFTLAVEADVALVDCAEIADNITEGSVTPIDWLRGDEVLFEKFAPPA